MTSSFWICTEIKGCAPFFKSYDLLKFCWYYFSYRLITFEEEYTTCNFCTCPSAIHDFQHINGTLLGVVLQTFVLNRHPKLKDLWSPCATWLCRGVMYVEVPGSTELNWHVFLGSTLVSSCVKLKKSSVEPPVSPVQKSVPGDTEKRSPKDPTLIQTLFNNMIRATKFYYSRPSLCGMYKSFYRT
jgi:hypothetical protein